MQAIKQAAREGDFAKLDALCEEWSVSTAAPGESTLATVIPAETNEGTIASPRVTREPEPRKKIESTAAREGGAEAKVEARR
jgi:hypothetical protein